MRHVSLIISNLPGMEYRYYIVGIHNSSGGFTSQWVMNIISCWSAWVPYQNHEKDAAFSTEGLEWD